MISKHMTSRAAAAQMCTIQVQFLQLVFVFYGLRHSQSSFLCDLTVRQIEFLLNRTKRKCRIIY